MRRPYPSLPLPFSLPSWISIPVRPHPQFLSSLSYLWQGGCAKLQEVVGGAANGGRRCYRRGREELPYVGGDATLGCRRSYHPWWQSCKADNGAPCGGRRCFKARAGKLHTAIAGATKPRCRWYQAMTLVMRRNPVLPLTGRAATKRKTCCYHRRSSRRWWWCCERPALVLLAARGGATSGRRHCYQPWATLLPAADCVATTVGRRCSNWPAVMLTASSGAATSACRFCYLSWSEATLQGAVALLQATREAVATTPRRDSPATLRWVLR